MSSMSFNRFLISLGALRVLLALLTITLTAVAPAAYGPVDLYTIQIIPSLLAPVLVPMAIFILLLDMLMTRVFMIEKSGTKRQWLKRILWFEMGLLILLVASWWPFFSRLVVR